MDRKGAERSALIAFNTVERLLRGDFFHTVSLEEVVGELRQFPAEWPVNGVGTTNWYRRNGELVIEGTAGTPAFLWADPGDPTPDRILDLLTDTPSDAGTLTTPSLTEDEREPRLPFAAVAVGDPGRSRAVRIDQGADLHEAITTWCNEENVGLAGVRIEGELAVAEYQSACHIPIGGVPSMDALAVEAGIAESERWAVSGLFAANPTVQNMVSALGRPVHLHGGSLDSRRGGHLRTATASSVTAELWPLQDLFIRIRDLDTAWLPVRELD